MNDPLAPGPGPGGRRRTAWLLAGTLLTVAALLFGIATVSTSIWPALTPLSSQLSPHPSTAVETVHQGYPRAAAQLDLDVAHGDVSIRAGAAERVDIERTLRWSGARPAIDETWSQDTLRIVADCPDTVSSPGRVCRVDQVVQAPPAVEARVRTDAGDIGVRDIDGALSLSTNAGTMTLTDVAGPLSLRSSAGDITGTGLRSPRVEAWLDAGTVKLRFDAAPDQVTVESSVGGVTIEVPPGDPYRVQVDTTVGTQRVDVAQEPGAKRVIEVRATVGDVRIRYAS